MADPIIARHQQRAHLAEADRLYRVLRLPDQERTYHLDRLRTHMGAIARLAIYRRDHEGVVSYHFDAELFDRAIPVHRGNEQRPLQGRQTSGWTRPSLAGPSEIVAAFEYVVSDWVFRDRGALLAPQTRSSLLLWHIAESRLVSPEILIEGHPADLHGLWKDTTS